MTMSHRRIRAIVRKELREYRRNGSIVLAMAIIPLLFVVQPLVVAFLIPASASNDLAHEHLLLYLLGIPTLVPAASASYAVVGERQQGTLEPVLTTPIRREEFVLGKAVASLIPSIGVAYAVYALFLTCVGLFADPAVAVALLRWPQILAQVLFTPLLAAWSIWVCLAISTRSNDVRVAQQLGMLACLPAVAVTSFVAFDAVPVTLGLALGLAAALLILDGFGWRAVSATVKRERLITGTR
jgi:ABC-2 type transport system permease protein